MNRFFMNISQLIFKVFCYLDDFKVESRHRLTKHKLLKVLNNKKIESIQTVFLMNYNKKLMNSISCNNPILEFIELKCF